MRDMTGATNQLTEAQERVWARRLKRAKAAHERTRQLLEEAITDARDAGVAVNSIAHSTDFSREWVRKIVKRVTEAREETGSTGHASESTASDAESP